MHKHIVHDFGFVWTRWIGDVFFVGVSVSCHIRFLFIFYCSTDISCHHSHPQLGYDAACLMHVNEDDKTTTTSTIIYLMTKIKDEIKDEEEKKNMTIKCNFWVWHEFGMLCLCALKQKLWLSLHRQLDMESDSGCAFECEWRARAGGESTLNWMTRMFLVVMKADTAFPISLSLFPALTQSLPLYPIKIEFNDWVGVNKPISLNLCCRRRHRR